MLRPAHRIRRILLVGLALAGLVGSPAPALEAGRALIELNLQSWQTQAGLPHNMVQDIAQTPDGYLWFGTWEGVARFNGFEFEIFDPYNVPELQDRGVRALLVDRDGALWLGTSRGGVTRYHDGQWTTIDSTDGLPGDEVLSLAQSADGRIWVGTEADGVGVIDGDSVSLYSTEDGLNDKAVLCMIERVPGEMWLGTREGAVRIDDEGVTAFDSRDGLPVGPVLSVTLDAEGGLLFGTQQGIYWFYEGLFGRHAGWFAAGQGQVSELMLDSDQVLWAGTFADGLFRVHGPGAETLMTRNGLPNNRITALFEDREKNLWVGTSGGLARLKSAPFSVLTMRNGLSDDYVRAVLESRDGSLWIATSNGLNHLQGTRSEVFTMADGLTSNSVLSLMEDRNGDLWVGTYGAGINIIRDRRVVDVHRSPDAVPSGHIRSIVESDDGSVWVGTTAGLTRFVDGEPDYTLDDRSGLPREYIQALYSDRDGTLWVGTIEGLARVRHGTVTTLSTRMPGYDAADVFGFHRDPVGNLWAATESGLMLIGDDDVARPFNRLHGLPHDVLFGITSDALGYLWMSSNAGIFRARIEDLVAVVNGRAATASVDHYTEDHGLSSRQANGGSQPSLLRASTGRLWFATAAGVAVVDPQILVTERDRQLPPSVVIESLLVDGQPVALRQGIRISPGARHFEFHYAGLSFRAPENVRYRYQLQGFDEPRAAGGERVAHYTNLDPGEYHFQVWASHDAESWDAPPARLRVRVDPHFYETRSFLALMLGLVALAVWAGVRLRVAALNARATELAQQVEERTRDLAQQTRRLERANEEKTRLLEQIAEQSRAFQRQAREDGLTGLANRRRFDEILEREFELARSSGTRLSLALIDIDHFKRVNDDFSHQAGDDVLKVVAARMKNLLGTEATVARYGGEEFAVLWPGLDLDTATERCEALRAALERHDYSSIAEGLAVTISAGVSDLIDVANHEKLVSDADRKLYQAKSEGRNRVVA